MQENHRGTQNNMLFPQLPELDSIKYYKQSLQVSIHHFYLVEEIDEVGAFLDMINVLKTSEPHDTIFIYLNTPGGNLYTAIQIISAIRQSNATVVTCLEGMVASAGTLIFLAGHKHVVNANCTFMIHNYSHGAWGKGNEVALRVKHSEQYFNKLAHDMYGKFLTEEELNEVINGKDFWMESEEVLRRLDSANAAASVGALMENLAVGEAAPAPAPDEIPLTVLELLHAELERALAEEEEETSEESKPVSKPRKRSRKKT